jgi:hypothetical protein
VDKRLGKVGAIGAVTGAILLFVGTFLHPMDADPNDALTAFTAYATDHMWVASHLTQFFGVALIVSGLVTLSGILTSGDAGGWAQLGLAGSIATLAVATVLQAVDGVALKAMVDAWAAASVTDKAMFFHAAFGVRQVEVGLASLMGLLFGLTVAVYGVALVVDTGYPQWLGWLGIIGGIPTAVAGVVMAYTGFYNLAMAINMPASSVVLIWMIIVGIVMWRRSNIDVAS